MKPLGVLLALLLMTGAASGCGGETPPAARDTTAGEKAAAEIAQAAVDTAAAENTAPDFPAAEPAPAVSAGGDSGLTPEFLTGQKFKLVAVNGVALHATSAPTLVFSPGFEISGKICNTFTGPAQLHNGLLTATPLASTRMACADEGLNQLETFFRTLLKNGAEISMDGTILYLKQGDTTLQYEAELAE